MNRTTMDINAFDSKLQTFTRRLKSQINPGVLPIVLTYDIYLTESGECCVGGYHSANGSRRRGQTYSYAAYEDSGGSFAQDVSALAREPGEWIDDPFVDNRVNCNDSSLMEVGDSLERTANSGACPYSLNGFTCNFQSLVFIGYFGAPRCASANDWLAFQNVNRTSARVSNPRQSIRISCFLLAASVPRGGLISSRERPERRSSCKWAGGNAFSGA